MKANWAAWCALLYVRGAPSEEFLVNPTVPLTTIGSAMDWLSRTYSIWSMIRHYTKENAATDKKVRDILDEVTAIYGP